VQTRLDGDHDSQVVRGYLFICLCLAEPVLRTCGSSGAAPGQKVGVGAQVTHGGSGAALSREVGARAAETCGSPEAAPSREAGAVVFT
jgi:hypothetical protein